MRLHLWLGGILMLLRAATCADFPCKVWMLNGDFLEVRYLGQEAEYCIFQADWQEPLLRIHGKYIDMIDFAAKDAAGPQGERRFYFGSADVIRGEILSMAPGELILKTAWADRLRMELRYLKKIETAIPAGQVLYEKRLPYKTWSNELPSWRGRLGRSMVRKVLQLPSVEGSFVIRLRVELPPLRQFTDSRIILQGFHAFREENGSGNRQVSFRFFENRLQVETSERLRVSPSADDGNSLAFEGDSLVIWVVFDESRNEIMVKVGDQALRLNGDGVTGTLNQTSKLHLTFMNREKAEAFQVRDLLMYRTHSPELATPGAETQQLFFKNGDALQAEWQGVDASGNWMLSGLVPGENTPMNPSRIYAWTAARDQPIMIKRKASHVGIQLAGGLETFIAEFIKVEEGGLVIRREGWEGEFRLPLHMIEVLRFNPYTRR